MALSASVIGVAAASPAHAADCVTPYLNAVNNPPPAPSPDDVVSTEGGTLTINAEVVAAYAAAVTDHFVAATVAFGNCAAADVYSYAWGVAICELNTPGVANLLRSSNPTARYVSVVGGIVQVHYATLVADAQAIVDCAGINLQITS
jgi:hypothetical protein